MRIELSVLKNYEVSSKIMKCPQKRGRCPQKYLTLNFRGHLPFMTITRHKV